MRRKCISIILLFTTFLFGSYALADTEGTVKFKGVITDPSCELDIVNAEIDLGKHIITELGLKTFQSNPEFNSEFDSTHYATLNVKNCPVKNGRLYIKFSGKRAEERVGNYYPFVDSSLTGAGVYLFVRDAMDTSKYIIINDSDAQEHNVTIDASKGTGSLTAYFQLYATRTTSVDTGTMDIPVVATLYMQ